MVSLERFIKEVDKALSYQLTLAKEEKAVGFYKSVIENDISETDKTNLLIDYVAEQEYEKVLDYTLYNWKPREVMKILRKYGDRYFLTKFKDLNEYLKNNYRVWVNFD